MASSECCRLCKGDVETLVSVFDKRINENLPAIVQVTTGIEITHKDEISQKLCLTCLQITIKMYKFRKTALKNNEELLAKHTQGRLVVESNKSTAAQNIPINKTNAQHQPSIRILPKYKNAHPSIKSLMQKYPSVVLPSFSLRSHVEPYITLDKDEVEEYFSDNGITPKQIEEQKRSAVKAAASFQERRPGVKRSHGCENDEQNSKRTCLPQVVPETKKLSKNVTLIRLNPPSVSLKVVPVAKNLSNGSNESPKNGSISRLVGPSSGKPNVVGPAFTKPNVVDPSFSKPNVIAKKKTLPSKPVSSETKNKNLRDGFPQSAGLIKEKHDQENRTQEGKNSEKSEADRMPRLLSILRPNSTEQRVNHVDTDHAYAHSDAASDSKRYKLRLQKNIIYDDEEQNSDSSSTVDASNYFQENDDVSSESSATSRSTISLLDSSLVSHSHKKTRTLYTCKVCDCVLYSKKDLQNHLQRTHTKCAFCSHRFRTTAARDEHVANDCSAKEVNNEPIKLKNPKLQLVRVDEIKEIRDKYQSAFAQEVANDVQNTVPTENNATTTTNITTNNTIIDAVIENRSDIICISDEETDKNTTTTPTTSKENAKPKGKPNVNLSLVLDSKPKINIVNSNILEKINMQDSDASILRLILKDVTKSIEKPQNKPPPNIEMPKNSSIEEGDTSRIQILRNLRTHLNLYRIPVDIHYGEKLKLEYNYSKVTGLKQKRDFWYNLPPKDIKKVTRQPSASPSVSNNTVPATPVKMRPNVNVTTPSAVQTPSTIRPKIAVTTPATFRPNVATNPNSQAVVQGGGLQSNSGIQAVVQGGGLQSNSGIQAVVQGGGLQSNSNMQAVVQGGGLQSNSTIQGVTNGNQACGSLNTTNAVYTIHNVSSQPNTLQTPGNLILTVQSSMNPSSVQNVPTSNPTSSTNNNVLLNVVPTMSHLPMAQPSNVNNRPPILLNTNPQKHVMTQYCSNETNFVIASIQGGVPAQNTTPTSNNIFLVTPTTTTTSAPAASNSGPTYIVVNKNVSKLNNPAQVYNPLSSAILTPLSTAGSQETFKIVQSSPKPSTAVSEVSSAPTQPVIRVKNLRELS